MSGDHDAAHTSMAEPTGRLLTSGATAVPVTAPDTFVGEVITASFRYRVEEKLGHGGTGSVYRATCLDGDDTEETPPREVAVKVLDLASGGLRARAVRHELAALRAIDSPHIPDLYDWSLEGERGYVVMALYRSGTLRDYLRDHGAYTEPQAWRLLHDLLKALRAAHNASVLHLDIKPANVMLDGRGGHVLTDFGISQGAHASGALRSIGRGTPGFRAPEQQETPPGTLDMRTDLYGVGSTVWSALTRVNLASRRSKAYWDPDPRAACTLPEVSSIRSEVSPILETALVRLLQYDKGRRPGSAPEVLSWLARLRGDEDVARLAGRWASIAEAEEIVQGLVDPLWHKLFQSEPRGLRIFEPGEVLCRQGDQSFYSFILVCGQVEVALDGRVVAMEQREGTFLGEVSALTGGLRTATLRAAETVAVRVLNTSQLEALVTKNPAIGIRLLRAMAERLSRGQGSSK